MINTCFLAKKYLSTDVQRYISGEAQICREPPIITTILARNPLQRTTYLILVLERRVLTVC